MLLFFCGLQALETLDNGKPYHMAYHGDLNLVIKTYRWEYYFVRFAMLYKYTWLQSTCLDRSLCFMTNDAYFTDHQREITLYICECHIQYSWYRFLRNSANWTLSFHENFPFNHLIIWYVHVKFLILRGLGWEICYFMQGHGISPGL